MKKTRAILILFVGSIFLQLLSACSFGGPSILDIVKEKYKISDTVKSSVHPEDTARLFTSDQSMSEVADTLKKEIKPDRITKQVDDKQVMVYEDYFVTLTKNEDDPNKTNIEVATYGFVRDNYDPSFFDGLMTYFILSQLFDVDDWGRRQGGRCHSYGGCYKGYNKSGGHYKGPGSWPLFRSTPLRGGGPGAGK